MLYNITFFYMVAIKKLHPFQKKTIIKKLKRLISYINVN